MRYKSLPKKEAQTRHALKRAHERYGKALTKGDLARMRKLIQRGEGRFIQRLTRTRTEHCVKYEDRWYRVVYDRSRKQICTFLNWRN